jgi:hypothetical protein
MSNHKEFLTNYKKVINDTLQPFVNKGGIKAITQYLDFNSDEIEALDTRIINLENNETIYQLFSYVGTSSTGQITIPEEATIFDVYGDGILDAILVEADENNSPTEVNSTNSSGDIVQVTSLDSDGNYVADGTPTENACILYFIKIKDKFKSNVPEDSIVGAGLDVLETLSIINTNVDYTIGRIDDTILLDGSNNTVTAFLPTAIGIKGEIYNIKCIDDTFACDVETDGTEEIDDDSANFDLIKDEVINIQSDNVNWWII